MKTVKAITRIISAAAILGLLAAPAMALNFGPGDVAGGEYSQYGASDGGEKKQTQTRNQNRNQNRTGTGSE